jgi:hypothetical protein
VKLRIWIEDEPLSPDADGPTRIHLDIDLHVQAPLPVVRRTVLDWLARHGGELTGDVQLEVSSLPPLFPPGEVEEGRLP